MAVPSPSPCLGPCQCPCSWCVATYPAPPLLMAVGTESCWGQTPWIGIPPIAVLRLDDEPKQRLVSGHARSCGARPPGTCVLVYNRTPSTSSAPPSGAPDGLSRIPHDHTQRNALSMHLLSPLSLTPDVFRHDKVVFALSLSALLLHRPRRMDIEGVTHGHLRGDAWTSKR